MIGESRQPTAEELDAKRSTRNALLCFGANIEHFGRRHFIRDESGQRLQISNHNPVTTEIARDYLPSFMGLNDALRLSDNVDIETATGLSKIEIGSITLYLIDMATLSEEC